jgi:hypothetical protein
MPNDFETAILERIALNNPSLREHFGGLHVLSREFTGVGSYTNFRIPEVDAQATRTHLSLDALIVMPNVDNGMGAVLFCRGGPPSDSGSYSQPRDPAVRYLGLLVSKQGRDVAGVHTSWRAVPAERSRFASNSAYALGCL